MNIIKELKWWIMAFIVIILIIIYSIISTMNQTVTENKDSSEYSITKNDSTEIKQLVSNGIIDCGTWGNTSKVTKNNASDYYVTAMQYALNASRPSSQYNGYTVSRHDKRTSCIQDYATDDGNIATYTEQYSNYDTMMSYSVNKESISISDPLKSKVSINGNSHPYLHVTASWESTESGLYPISDDNNDTSYGDPNNKYANWGHMSTIRTLESVSFFVEKTDDGWRISRISGGNWKQYGYVNALANAITLDDGAERIVKPSSYADDK